MSFQKRLSSGEFLVLAEMNTPKGVDISEMIMNARRIKGRVDAVIVPDMDDGVMKMSALGGGVLMNQQGIEPIIHVYCRDRNRMALQGDLLSAYVLGIQNLMVVHGEDMAFADHSETKPVDDISELEFLAAISALQDGRDMAGSDLQGRPDFTIGCSIAPYSDDEALKSELDLAQKKVEAGAQYVVSPPVFDIEHFGGFLEKAKGLKVPIIPTVFLIKTVGIARYMATYEPGARISEELIKRLRKAKDRDTESVQIAGETISGLRDLVRGVKIVTLGWEHRIPAILDFAGI
jgi:5,10-methylenetetrahydrofolate reductase